MPKRTREHILEDESVIHFRKAISPWVYRPSIPDYGIDAQVEIFEQSGESSGLLFLCQLKATDQEQVERALTIRLKKELYQYYMSLDLPIMMVRYHSPSRKIFWRWVHEFDPYYGGKGSKSWAFSLDHKNEWKESSRKIIREELILRRMIQSGNIRFPIPIHLYIYKEGFRNVPWEEIEISIEKIRELISHLVTFCRRKSEKELFTICFRHDRITYGVRNSITTTIHLHKNHFRGVEPDKIVMSIIAGLAAYLGSIGCVNEATELAGMSLHHSLLANSERFTMTIAGFFMRARKFERGLDLANALLEKGIRPVLLQMFVFMAFLKTYPKSATILRAYESFLKKTLKEAEKIGNKRDVAICHYNIGNYFRASGPTKLRRSLKHYKDAATFDKSYEKRDYFWREIAGIYFGLEKFSKSANCYGKALTIGVKEKAKRDVTMALKADALMFAGRYAKAEDAFEEYLHTAKNIEDEYCLKKQALEILTRQLGIVSQKRDPKKATEIAEKHRLDGNEDYKNLYQAIEKDALSSLAWFNIGVSAGLANETTEAFFALLLAALVNRSDNEAWANCCLLFFKLDRDPMLLFHVIRCAYSINGANFLERLKSDISRQLPKSKEILKNFLALVLETVDEIEQETQPAELRIHTKGGWDTVEI